MAGGARQRHLRRRQCRRRRDRGTPTKAPTRSLPSISYTLGANVENLTLTGSGTSTAPATRLANVITGNGGDNVLDGGAGADTMTAAPATTPTSSTMPATWSTEAANERHRHGAERRQLHARRQRREPDPDRQRQHQRHRQRLDNVITGNGGNNILDGGAGADTMTAALGNDTYVVDNAGDVVTENANEGTDTVQSPRSPTRSAPMSRT